MITFAKFCFLLESKPKITFKDEIIDISLTDLLKHYETQQPFVHEQILSSEMYKFNKIPKNLKVMHVIVYIIKDNNKDKEYEFYFVDFSVKKQIELIVDKCNAYYGGKINPITNLKPDLIGLENFDGYRLSLIDRTKFKYSYNGIIIEQIGKPELVGYEWRNRNGEKFSTYDGGLVRARVSDWDKSETSELSNRTIVHVYWIKLPDGTVKPFGKNSAMKILKLTDSTALKGRVEWLKDMAREKEKYSRPYFNAEIRKGTYTDTPENFDKFHQKMIDQEKEEIKKYYKKMLDENELHKGQNHHGYRNRYGEFVNYTDNPEDFDRYFKSVTKYKQYYKD